jgi:HEAT repeat protein
LRWLRTPQPNPEAAVVSAVVSVLEKGEPSERQAAAWALGLARPAAPSVVDTLARHLRSDDSAGVRASTARALGTVAWRAGVPALFDALGDPSEAVRAAAAQALSRIGPGASDVAPLAAALRSPDCYVAGFAAWSLGNLEAEAAPAVSELGRALARPETNDVVTRALSRIGPAATAAVPDLVRELGNADDVHRWRAARTLGRIGPGAEPALAALVAALKDPSGAVRMHAARALGRIGPAAMTAAPALQRTTGDRDGGVRDAAREALERLSGRPD